MTDYYETMWQTLEHPQSAGFRAAGRASATGRGARAAEGKQGPASPLIPARTATARLARDGYLGVPDPIYFETRIQQTSVEPYQLITEISSQTNVSGGGCWRIICWACASHL